jgi:hypothetical protein
MDILNSFMGQALIAQIGEIVLFANTVTMAMPTRWRWNMMMDYFSKILNYLAMNIGKNRNMDEREDTVMDVFEAIGRVG